MFRLWYQYHSNNTNTNNTNNAVIIPITQVNWDILVYLNKSKSMHLVPTSQMSIWNIRERKCLFPSEKTKQNNPKTNQANKNPTKKTPNQTKWNQSKTPPLPTQTKPKTNKHTSKPNFWSQMKTHAQISILIYAG